MEFKEYQQSVLGTVDAYLDALTKHSKRAVDIEKVRQEQPGLGLAALDFPDAAWKDMKTQGRLPPVRAEVPFSPRADSTGRHVPSICLKVPTGGGKTLLATASVSRVLGRYLGSNRGFVLWIVPNEAIYTQTKKQLTNREHAYRQMLDRAAAGRVKILEKDDRLDRRDVDTHLCVMLLMLQSANRETKETLRIFRDRGNVHGFFPAADDVEGHFALLQGIPNLTAYSDQDRNNRGSIVQDSLGNVLRYIRPVVVMDEGHKAYSSKAIQTLYDFNPCFVLELSATPKDRPKDKPPRYANWLVDVRGVELSREEMIKLPINVKVKSGDDWRDTLRESLEHLDKLQAAADKLHGETARYVRPIMLVQVERTGKDQIEKGFIHANNAKEFLLSAGLTEREIAIKTSDTNDLNEPENIDLLKETCPVRVIITKQALQEGWDCPFAYLLCSLSGSKNINAMTQLVGRILRQPNAQRTGITLLDECYVFCLHGQTKAIVEAIKGGLEQDGMADLALEIREMNGGGGGGQKRRAVKRRPAFAKLEIFLPLVNWVEKHTVRALDYEQDILLGLDWRKVSMKALADKIPADANITNTQMTRVTVTDGSGGEFFSASPTEEVSETPHFDPVYATRIVSDLVPNAWVARELVGELLKHLKAKGFDDAKFGALSSLILEETRKHLAAERDRLAEAKFMDDVTAERVQFRLRTDTHNWKMPAELPTDLPPDAATLVRPSGNAIDKSLFAPAYREDYNGDEKEFACYLDENAALKWWHRNVARAGYFVQGWKPHRVYPDFIFALRREGKAEKMVVIETKGDQLDNLDTDYKRRLLRLMAERYRFEKTVKAGQVEIVIDAGTTVACDLLLMSEWKTKLHTHLKP